MVIFLPIDPAPVGLQRRRAKATADPSISLRSAQDDSIVIVQSILAGSLAAGSGFGQGFFEALHADAA
jgi:hypothetical protein